MKGKKMKFPFLFKSSTIASSDGGAWPWPTCTNNPKTLSFRHTTTTSTTTNDDRVYKTMNSAYYTTESVPQDSIFSITTTTNSFHTHHEEEEEDEEDILNNDVVLQGLRSERLFFEPGETNSILKIAKSSSPVLFPYKESASIVAMDSRDPFVDFRASMEEMVEAHNFKDWVCLEELLTCYLRVNEKSNHGYIVAAFVDLLLHLSMTSSVIEEHGHKHEHEQEEQCSSSNSTTRDYSFTSPLSFDSCSYSVSSTSPCLSSLDHNDQDEKKVVVNF